MNAANELTNALVEHLNVGYDGFEYIFCFTSIIQYRFIKNFRFLLIYKHIISES